MRLLLKLPDGPILDNGLLLPAQNRQRQENEISEEAISNQPSEVSHKKNVGGAPALQKRREKKGNNTNRFLTARIGMTISQTGSARCVNTMDTRLIMEPVYSDWKTGNQRRLRQWPVVECKVKAEQVTASD